MSKLKHVHDGIFKAGMTDLRVAEDMLEQYLPVDIREEVDFSTLKLCQTHFVDKKLKQTESDMLYRVDVRGNHAYLYFLCEHQSTPDKNMPLRLMQYTLRIIENHLSEGFEHYPIVFPSVVYNGEQTPYPYPSEYAAYYEDIPLAENHMFKRFNLIDLSATPDRVLRLRQWSSLMQLLMKHHRHSDLLGVLLDLADIGTIDFQLEKGGEKYISQMLEYVLNSPQLSCPEKAVSLMSKKSKDLGEIGMTLLSMKETGRQEGRQEGRQDMCREAVERMLSRGMDDGLICDLLHISPRELNSYKRQIH